MQHPVEQEAKRQRPPATRQVLFGFLLVLALYSFSQSAFFRVKTVKITGLERVTADEVQRATGISPGVNYWRVDRREAASNLEALLRVKGAAVTRVFPDEVVIEIQERKLVAVIPFRDTFLELDETGIILGFLDNLVEVGVPVITGLEPSNLAVGGLLQVPGLRPALLVAALLREKGMGYVSEIHVEALKETSGPPVREMVLYHSDGTPVYLVGSGPPGGGETGPASAGGATFSDYSYFRDPEEVSETALNEKIANLETVMKDLAVRGDRAGYIDLRFSSRPVVKVR